MLRVSYSETALCLANIVLLVFGAVITVDAIVVERVRARFIWGTENTLQLPSSGNMGIAAGFVKCTFQSVGDASWYEGYFRVWA